MSATELNQKVKAFWDKLSCGEVYASGESEEQYYAAHSKARYTLEPYIFEFAGFTDGYNKDILEIGIGMGADHVEWARSKPKSLTGIDLTPRAARHTRKRLEISGLSSRISVSDAEQLPFRDHSFDMVYSWGVLHHSPNTGKALDEVFRVLRPGGVAKIMIYHKYALTGYMLWTRYALLTGRVYRSLDDIYFNHLESPGTKAYTIQSAQTLFSRFSQLRLKIQLSGSDLLEGSAGQRHQGVLLTLAREIWPRMVMKKLFRNHGLFLLVEARKR
jgi:SAM-dependent methyltransferase